MQPIMFNHSFQPLVESLTKNLRELSKNNIKIKNHKQFIYCKELAVRCKKDLKELDMFKIKANDKKAADDKKRISKKLKAEFENEMKRLEQNTKEMSLEMEQEEPSQQYQEVKQEKTPENNVEIFIPEQKQKQENVKDMQHQREILQERERQIREIERDVIEINEMMQDTAQLVKDQGEHLQLIEDIVEKAQETTYQGTLEVRKASIYQQSSKKKLTIFVIVVAIVAATALAMALTIFK